MPSEDPSPARTDGGPGRADEAADERDEPTADGADDEPSEPTAEEADEEPSEPTAEQADLTFDGAVEMPTTKDHLWSVISDPAVLTECVPGAETVERLSERRYRADITRGLSKLTVSLSGEVEFVEMAEPDYVVASGSAHDSKTGSDLEVLAAMEIAEVDEGVELIYSAEIDVTGGAAALSWNLLRPIVRNDIENYFDNVREAVEADKEQQP